MSALNPMAGASHKKFIFKRAGWACLAGLMALAAPVFSAVNNTASLANPLDNNGGGARALGMGSAFVSVADDSSAMLWNPAGLGHLKNGEVALHHNSWLAGIVQETLLGALPIGGLGGFGASFNYVNYGTLAGYDEGGNKVEDYSANRYGLGLGWGRKVVSGLYGGVSVKGSMQSVSDTAYSNLSIDLGILWKPMPEMRVGLAYSNLGTTVASYNVASALRCGASYRFIFSSDNQLLLASSASWEPMGVSRLQLGFEDTILSMLALRLGYQASLADNQTNGLTGVSAGLGVTLGGFGLDYAYLPYGDLGGAHRISLDYKFGS